MNPARQTAIQYLSAPVNGLWRWAEEGKVLIWKDGTTIAFREEIQQMLPRLSAGGLPSFGAIVFLLAACRGKFAVAEELLTDARPLLQPAAGANAVTLMSARLQRMAQLEAALLELRRLPDLPAELISGVRAKGILLEAVFENSKAERYVVAQQVLLGMLEPLGDADLVDREPAGTLANGIRQIHLVAEGLRYLTTESLLLRLRTNLEALPEEADLTLPAAERARRLIEELSKDPEHGSMALIANDLMAALRMPRRLVERDFVAVGCVSDIANRGPLDRLLLSELAHDDLTLSVRVALNEALYLRREPPMREPPGTLALLLDSGLRMWGVPRVFAAAVSLALIAKETRRAEILCWRGSNGSLVPVDLLSRQGLTDHLSALEVDAHPGAVLDAFGQAVPKGEHHSVLITHCDVLDDEEFRRALAQAENPPGFIAVVDRKGNFELYELPLSRRHPICRAQLDVEGLSEKPFSSTSSLKRSLTADLPAIFGVTPFPFLLPISGRIDYWVRDRDGFTYVMLNDRRLARFRGTAKGGRVLAWDLPAGKTIWMDCFGGMVCVMKSGSSQRPARLICVEVGGGRPGVHELGGGPEILAAHRYGDVVLAIRSHDVRAFSLIDGRLLDQVRNPAKWSHGRFLRGPNSYYFAAWDGEGMKLERVSISRPVAHDRVAAVFDREGYEAPWCLLHTGVAFSLASDAHVNLGLDNPRDFDFATARVSRDGHRILLQERKTAGHRLFHLEKNFQIAVNAGSPLEPKPSLSGANLHRIVEALAVEGKTLLMAGRRKSWREFILATGIMLRLRTGAEGSGRSKVTFDFPAKKTDFGCSLQVVRWESGSVAFLDSRGLLHLKSHDPSAPEISLLLAAQEVAGWTSDGHVCGPPYFFDRDYLFEPQAVFERIEQFVRGL